MRTLPILLCGCLSVNAVAAAPRPAVIHVPVADVWNKTVTDPDFLKDENRETQVLQGEQVLVKEINGEWARVEATQQPEFTHHHRWEGYPGWMYTRYLDLEPHTDTSSVKTPPFEDPLAVAETLIRTPYLWGGLSKEGIDCSGLVHLAYRRHGIVVPRDSHEQWMKATPIKRAELRPGDLIFSAKSAKPKTITHVVLYAGDGQILEAPQTGMVVRRVSFQEKFGKAFESVESGDRVGDRILYFGRFQS